MQDEFVLPDDMNEEDDEVYVLTPWGCLFVTLMDYGIDVDHISGRVGEHIVDDFMDAMVKAGYLAEKKECGVIDD